MNRLFRLSAGVFLLSAATQASCYVYSVPPSGQPVPGSRYSFAITDQGRVGLADRLGPGVETIEGTLVGQNGGGYLVSVTRIKSIGGGFSHWAGERVAVSAEHVATVRERRLSRRRTALAAGAAVAAVGTFIATRGLFGFGPNRDDPPSPPCCDQ
jgi:hypothetical protein